MAPVDEGSEEPTGSPPSARRAGSRVLVPLVVAGSAVVVVGTALGGLPRVTPLQLSGPFGLPRSPAPAASQPPAEPPPAQPASSSDPLLPTVLTVLAIVVAVAAAVVLIRLLVRVIRARRRTGLRGVRGVDVESAQPVADAPAVLRGIAAALVAFDGDRAPGDAVVQAWLGLQQAAEDGGFARSAAETPTEFTGRVLSRTGTDRVALGALLRLYLRARFGDGAITGTDAADARDALRALESSWQRVAAVDRG